MKFCTSTVAYGAQEGGSTNAVEPEDGASITDAQVNTLMFVFEYISLLSYNKFCYLNRIIFTNICCKFWYGHAAQNNDWHVHNPYLGEESPTDSTFLGYALGKVLFLPFMDLEENTLTQFSNLLFFL